ncbi:type IV pilus modification protein PilV [Herbaspirillum sp. RV1423]|uniref:type IV pilus modification protein PilV n=1 Tax=Herbaspirillum sp. RV1423 TaxID=1443993 RepID=UPI0004AE0795|nr:type IV pilus modification protein PilV [Herbaspirillum sp. RV1423]
MNKTPIKSGEQGFTLVEVLVAIVILALGASGVVAMQLHALRTAQQSGFQSNALQLAMELAELMRTDAAADRDTYLFDYDAAGDAATSAACAGQSCDLAAWKQRLRSALPQARATVCRDSAPVPGEAPHWPCTGSGNAPIVIKLGWSTREKTPQQPRTLPSLVLVAEP